jgi:hypothetical protein
MEGWLQSQWESPLLQQLALIRSAQNCKDSSPKERRRMCMERELRTEQEDLNWNAVLGMMALALVSFGLYGAAVGTYFTLTN